MKSKFALQLLAAATVFSFAQPMLAATKKNEPRRAALVAALQAVSPDALGGRLGLTIATAQTPKSSDSAPVQRTLAKSGGRSVDQLDYRSWKNANKS